MAWVSKGNIRGPQGATGNTGATGADGPAGTAGEKWFGGTGVPSGSLIGSVQGDWYLNYSNGDVYEKTGSTTWTLRANITGPQGATGSQGVAGTAGEVWFSGVGAPPTATGAIGDWYINTATGDYYEKTGSAAWSLRGNLRGPTGNTGADGTPGEKWWSGSGAPPTGTGVVGDWFLRTDTGDYYEKTGTSVWTLRGNLTGPQGAQGIQGVAGTGVPTSGLVIGDHLRAISTTAWDNLPPSFFTANLTNPATSTTTASTMAGFGAVAKITPNASGKLLVTWCGRFYQPGTSGTGKADARYGTGTAPANGAALTGTLMGNACYVNINQGVSQFAITSVISVTKGTPYWFDLTQASGVAGQAFQLFDCTISVVEL